MAEETKIPLKELLLVLGLGGGQFGSTYLNSQSIKEQIASNKELAEQVRDSLAVREMLNQQRVLENDVSELKLKATAFKKDIDWLSATCIKK